jgi:uncharacterized protein
MRCRYCFYAEVSKGRDCVMSDETLENIVRKSLAFAEDSCAFAFQGGEPTLAGIEFYKKVIQLQRAYRKRDVHVTNAIQTNGLGVTEEFAAFFAENGFLVGLSMDGNADTHDALRPDASGRGTYARVRAAAKLLRRHDAEFNILCVVNRLTAAAPGAVYDALKQYQFLQFIPCIDVSDGEAFSPPPALYANFLKVTFDRYYNGFERGDYVSVRNFDGYVNLLLNLPPDSCAARGVCGGYCLIEADGSVYPCDFYASDAWRLGNINETGLVRITNGEKAARFVDASKNIPPDCAACEWHFLCRGGCARDRQPFGGVPGRNRYCAAYREFFPYAYERLRDIAYMISK